MAPRRRSRRSSRRYDDALSHLRRQKALGAFSVKSYNQQRRDARQMIIKAARELQMMVVPEGGLAALHERDDVLDGHTGVEHSLPVPRLYKDVVTLFAKSKTGYTPTLIVGYGGLSGEYYWYQNTNVWENERLLHVHAARDRGRALAAADDGAGRRLQPRPDREGRQADRSTPAASCSSARTASCRGLARTGSCGCCSRAA